MYQVFYTPTFEKSFKQLDGVVQQRLKKKIQWLADNPQLLNDRVKYTPPELDGLRKYRLGDWRLLFWVNHAEKTLTLYLIDRRGSVYLRFE